MDISSNVPLSTGITNQAVKSTPIKSLYTEKLSKDEVKEIRNQIQDDIAKYMFTSVSFQSVATGKDAAELQHDDFQSFLSDIGYNGKPIAELSQDEAKKLVADDGIFGIDQTSQRIANFVINGANGDEEKFRAGREGILLGFKQAEKMWGSDLPDISQKTMQASIELIDKAMHEAGYAILNEEI